MLRPVLEPSPSWPWSFRCRRRARGKWQLDEVQLKIKGKRHWLWRGVEQDGLVLDILVQESVMAELTPTANPHAPRLVLTQGSER